MSSDGPGSDTGDDGARPDGAGASSTRASSARASSTRASSARASRARASSTRASSTRASGARARHAVGTPDGARGSDDAVGALLDWYAHNARDLPWRTADRDPWGVLVSEVMLQQTQVSRVEPRWREWMQRWPTPAALAAAPLAEVLRHWQGLGYPRRALRLQQAAAAIVAEHDGRVPSAVASLRALPGVGEYTAAAVAAFAFGEPVAVLDTNVRRVYARWRSGRAFPGSGAITAAERDMGAAMLPGDGLAPLWSVAVMELGALVCSARSPRCDSCPLRTECSWVAAGRPPGSAPVRQAPFAGSDRQARGFLLRRVTVSGPADPGLLIEAWARHRTTGGGEQARRAMASLLADGLLETGAGGEVRLPGS